MAENLQGGRYDLCQSRLSFSVACLESLLPRDSSARARTLLSKPAETPSARIAKLDRTISICLPTEYLRCYLCTARAKSSSKGQTNRRASSLHKTSLSGPFAVCNPKGSMHRVSTTTGRDNHEDEYEYVPKRSTAPALELKLMHIVRLPPSVHGIPQGAQTIERQSAGSVSS